MIINKSWAMPNKNTFSIKPIRQIIDKYLHGISIDPFANSNTFADVTNDIDYSFNTAFNLDALDFLSIFPVASVDTVLYDPPYSPRQVAECYKKLGRTVNMQTTQSSYWSNQKKEIARIVKRGGIVITCGWNSGGIGKRLGFVPVEILLVSHGGWHNDTIVTVERKNKDQHPRPGSPGHNHSTGRRIMKKTLKCEICGKQKPRAEITRCANSITKRGQTCDTCLADLSAGGHKFWSGENGDYDNR